MSIFYYNYDLNFWTNTDAQNKIHHYKKYNRLMWRCAVTFTTPPKNDKLHFRLPKPYPQILERIIKDFSIVKRTPIDDRNLSIFILIWLLTFEK